MFRLDIASEGADQLFTNNTVNFLWQVQADQQELDIQSEKRETQLGLYGEDGFDYFTMSDGLNESWEKGVKWLGVKQVVPMHCDTFPMLTGTVEQLEQHLVGSGIEVLKLKPGETAE